MRSAVWIVSLALLALLLACSDEDSKKPCPPKGIGVEEFEGVSAGDQLLNYQNYACSEPQICPDLVTAAIAPYYVIDESAAPAQASVGLTNCSTGNKKLVIEQVVLVGDKECAFTCPCRRDKSAPCARCQVSIEKSEIEPGETISISIEYKPTKARLDGAAFHVYSNAQNFSRSVTPICVRALDDPPGGSSDAGAGDGGGGNAPAPPRCDFIDPEVNTTCHEPRLEANPSTPAP